MPWTGNSPHRQRGRAWQEKRRKVLSANPLCVECQRLGFTTAATQVDHVIPLSKGGSNDDSNLAGMCKVCHAQKSQVESTLARGGKPRWRPRIGKDGWPVDG